MPNQPWNFHFTPDPNHPGWMMGTTPDGRRAWQSAQGDLGAQLFEPGTSNPFPQLPPGPSGPVPRGFSPLLPRPGDFYHNPAPSIQPPPLTADPTPFTPPGSKLPPANMPPINPPTPMQPPWNPGIRNGGNANNLMRQYTTGRIQNMFQNQNRGGFGGGIGR